MNVFGSRLTDTTISKSMIFRNQGSIFTHFSFGQQGTEAVV
jgi:hypothetical protein